MLQLLWLLLPVAAASGWYAARRSARRSTKGLDVHYVQGLNYLISEQPDKAIEVFTRMVEVVSDTVEVHVALGNLFRRRGEVDRAIRIHQNLIARPSLTRVQRAMALLELGEDYLRAGLLDRAESLFKELTDAKLHTEAALRHLVGIYEQEKEWADAIDAAQRLESVSGKPLGPVIAQYHCELAEQARREDGLEGALRGIKRALAHDPGCVRATIMQGHIEMELGRYKAACQSFMRVPEQDVEYLSEVLTPLKECFQAQERPDALGDFLRNLLERHPNTAAVVAMADLLEQQRGTPDAAEFLAECLNRNPSLLGIQRLVRLYRTRAEGERRSDLRTLGERMERLFEDVPAYFCTHCGFNGKALHWQCPGCGRWSTLKPMRGMSVHAFLATTTTSLKTRQTQ
ncbi:MAG: lipopolysaccharide assembly protein LapB [Gammaproteobacteria bacterium]